MIRDEQAVVGPRAEVVAPARGFTPYLDALRLQLAAGAPAPYSLPGHQGRPILAGESELFAAACTRLDVAATGNLHVAKALLDAKFSRIYGGEVKVVTTGGSGANRVALRAMLRAPRDAAPGDPYDVLVARGVHTSVPAALAAIPGARPRYLPLRRDDEGAIVPTSPEDVARGLDAHPAAVGVVITSPTIAGRCADVPAIAAVIAERNARTGARTRLHVDQAWGSHFALSPRLPPTALRAGADSFSTSLHKNVDGALTGLAVFGTTERDEDLRLRAQAIAVAEDTTSCSSLLLAGADAATSLPPEAYARRYDLIAQAVAAMREYCEGVAGVRVMTGAPALFDASRFTFRVLGVEAKRTGARLAVKGVRTLLSDGAYVSLHFTAPPTETEIERILGAIEHAAREGPESAAAGLGSDGLPFPDLPQILTPHAALHAPRLARVPLRTASGRVCADPLIAIPPGISLITYGQPYTPELIAAIAAWRAAGAVLKGLSSADEVLVVD